MITEDHVNMHTEAPVVNKQHRVDAPYGVREDTQLTSERRGRDAGFYLKKKNTQTR